MPNTALTLHDVTLSLYPAGEDGTPALDAPVYIGACAERLRLTDEFVVMETRPTGRRYPKKYPLVMTHGIGMERVWITQPITGPPADMRSFVASNARFVLDVLWEDEASDYWKRRTYYG